MPSIALKFVVSAPGKVILFGEHSVVYGKPALAASINKRSTLVFECSDDDAIEIDLSTLNLSLIVPLNVAAKVLRKFVPQNGDNARTLGHHVPYCDSIIEGVENYELLERNQRVSIFCVFYLLYRFCSATEVPLGAFKISLSSEIAVGAGTGSSASFSVCLAAAFFHYFRASRNSGGGSAEKVQFSAEDKQIINDYAFACEQIIHGRASGIDNFVCTYGSIIEMGSQDDETNHNKIFRALENVSMFRIFLINTGIERSTAKMVQNVRDLHSRNPSVVNAILEAMGATTKSACSTLFELKENEQNTFGTIYANLFKKLEDLISLNHGLLVALGVSHRSLDTIVGITKKYDLHSKLTGAGGGGFAFTLIPPYRPNDVILNCKHELEESGFVVDDITIGGEGVDIKML